MVNKLYNIPSLSPPLSSTVSTYIMSKKWSLGYSNLKKKTAPKFVSKSISIAKFLYPPTPSPTRGEFYEKKKTLFECTL